MDEPVAPAEPVAVDLASVKQAFSSGPPGHFLDLSGRFTFADRAKLVAGVHELQQKTGAKVWVLALPGKTDVNPYGAIHAELKMAPKDVLFIFSVDKRHLHSQQLTKAVGNDILKATNKEFYKSQTNGILAMLKEIDTRMTGMPATPSPVGSAPGTVATQTPSNAPKQMIPTEYVLLTAAVAVVAWLVLRKKPTPPPPVTVRAKKPRPARVAPAVPKPEKSEDDPDAEGA